MADLSQGIDAWSREARQVRDWATVLGLVLDEKHRTLRDVRCPQALHASLHDLHHARRGGSSGGADPRQRDNALASRMTHLHETCGE